ncbi:glucose-1-phosphate adenylyltransferase [Salinisphaera sp. SPP-AMP-43]|uniref:glucose-1-phosphate adenylyltransferase n=1 Tax=Salinisphaera sp. SPP-AMP-43 TaxID=3121288 RepID=UPI003C6DCB4C
MDAETQKAHSNRFISLVTRDTLAMVLAGGRGTRLGGLTRRRAKPAVPFGGEFRIIDFVLSNCINSGIRRVSVLTQYMAHPLIRHMHQAWGFLRGEFGEFVEVVPAQQRLGESWYRGTADAVYQNLDLIAEHEPRFVLILGGDHVYKMDYGPMLGFHLSHNADVTVGCVDVSLDEARSFGVMSVDDDLRISAFSEKPNEPTPMPGRPDRALASMGIYVFSTDYLIEMLEADALDTDSSRDFGKDVLPAAVSQGHAVYAYHFSENVEAGTGYWRDVGTLDGYWKANLELINVMPELNLYDRDWPIWTYQEQVPPAKFVFDDHGRRGEAVNSMVAGGCIVSGATVRRSLLFSSVLVAERSVIEDSVILPNVVIGSDCRIQHAVIDSDCHIPDGTQIRIDESADFRRFEVTEDGVVLVTREALDV